MKTENVKNHGWKLFIIIGIIFCLNYLHFASFKLADDNLGVLFPSYKNGFLSAGLVGTIWRFVNQQTTVNLMSYEPVYTGAKHMLMLYYILTAVLIVMLYRKCKEKYRDMLTDFFCILVVLCGGMFGCADTLGSYDMYQMIVMLAAMILIVAEKGEWLLVPLMVIGMLIHPSFLLKNAPLLLLLLWYRYHKNHEKKYKGILWISGILAAVLFLVSEVSALGIQGMYDESLQLGQLLSLDATTYDTNFAARALRECSALLPEWGYHGNNYIGLLLCLLACSPYLLLGRHFFVKANKNLGADRKLYRLLQLGGLFLLPEFLLKIKYGYFIYEVAVYYVLLFLFYITEDDAVMVPVMEEVRSEVRERWFFSEILLLYPLLYMPFLSVSISGAFDFAARLLGA
jgi:hypothetical protein